MSEVNATFVVNSTPVQVAVTSQPISVNPQAIGLSITTTSTGLASSLYANVANVHIYDGANAYFLQTDGLGNLTWAPGTANVSGNGTAAGANTQIQISDGAGNFTSAAGFTFNKSSNLLSVPGNITATGNVSITGNVVANLVTGTLTTSSQPNITNLGTLTSLNLAGLGSVQEMAEKAVSYTHLRAHET